MRSIFIPLLLILLLQGISQAQTISSKKLIVVDRTGKYLDSLVKSIGDKRIVAIGEDTHGTAEFYELRAAITRRLILDKGFTTVILENPHEDMMALRAAWSTEHPDSLMRKHLFAIYQSQQMKDFLTWFAGQTGQNKKLKLAGCDDSYRELLPAYLKQAGARYHDDSLNSMLREFQLRQQLDAKSYYAQVKGPRPDSIPKNMAYMRELYQLADRIDSFCVNRRYNDPSLKELLMHAKTAYIYYERFARKKGVSRDEIMGERINYYAADPAAKIIVWAHSGHVAKYAWLMDEIGLMGATVSKAFPHEYFAIGLSGGTGTYSYIENRFINNDHDFSDSLFNAELHEPVKNSWNKELMSLSSTGFLLDFSTLSEAERAEVKKQRSLKMLGYGKESKDGKEYYPVVLTDLFDALIFLPETRHTTPIF